MGLGLVEHLGTWVLVRHAGILYGGLTRHRLSRKTTRGQPGFCHCWSNHVMERDSCREISCDCAIV